MLTEEQARQKFCPMIRPVPVPDGVLVPDGQAAERDDNGAIDAVSMKCIASGCAMWRWAEFDHQEKRLYQDRDKYGEESRKLIADGWTRVSHGNSYTAAKFERSVPLNGFCGLGGKP